MSTSKKSEKQLDHLTDMQYKVTQEDATEPPFKNEFWNNHEASIYVDVVSGEPLFASIHKYDSGSGWPSFTQPIKSEAVITKKDFKLVLPRTEIRSKGADSHLGHVFNDGPGANGQRYCINSAALKFVPLADLEKEGYGQFIELFEKEKK